MLDLEQFRRAMSMLAASVTAVTVRDQSGSPRGLVATAVFSYSAEPPTLAVSIAHSSRSHAHLTSSSRIGVHLLAGAQSPVAGVLASKTADKFAALDWSWRAGVPYIHGSLVAMSGRVSRTFDFLDHTILFVELEELEIDSGVPLIYFERELRALTRSHDHAAA